MDNVIEVKNLFFKYPGSEDYALKDISLSIKKGSLMAIIGQNGAGKTTLTKHFNGLYRATAGEVSILGDEISTLKTHDIIKLVGYCYQNPDHQLFSRSVYDEVVYGPKNLGFTEEQIKENVDVALQVTQLDDRRDRYPFTLGRGERQRLAIASVLSMGSPVLIVDEPTTGLDTRGKAQIMDLLKQWNENNHTVVIVTHDIALVADHVPELVVMAEGQIIAHGPTKEVLADEKCLAKAFVKQPQITRLANSMNDKAFTDKVFTVNDMVDVLESYRNGGTPNGSRL